MNCNSGREYGIYSLGNDSRLSADGDLQLSTYSSRNSRRTATQDSSRKEAIVVGNASNIFLHDSASADYDSYRHDGINETKAKVTVNNAMGTKCKIKGC